MNEDILGFYKHNGYFWLSNFYPCIVKLDDLVYQSSEAAYMAQKVSSEKDKKQFTLITNPAEAKKLGQLIHLRSDWDFYRVLAMTRVVYAKFSQNPLLKEWLLSTNSSYLEETNTWGDRFWGKDIQGNGVNMLGQILMHTRDCLK